VLGVTYAIRANGIGAHRWTGEMCAHAQWKERQHVFVQVVDEANKGFLFILDEYNVERNKNRRFSYLITPILVG